MRYYTFIYYLARDGVVKAQPASHGAMGHAPHTSYRYSARICSEVYARVDDKMDPPNY